MRILPFTVLLIAAGALGSPHRLWYDQPAAAGMTEPLPIGKGRLGGLLYGASDREQVVLNEIDFCEWPDSSSAMSGQ